MDEDPLALPRPRPEPRPERPERVVRFGNPNTADQTLVQMNCRVPRWMKDKIDERRLTVTVSTETGDEPVSRDEWVRRVLEWALLQPPGTPVRSSSAGPARRRLPGSQQTRSRRTP